MGSLVLEAPAPAGPSFGSHPSAKPSGEGTNWFTFSAMSHSVRSILQGASAGGGVRVRAFGPDGGGGAGVHVEYLSAELSRLVDVEVRRFEGEPLPEIPGAVEEQGRRTPTVESYSSWDRLDGPAPYAGALRTMSTDLAMAAGMEGADVVHSHTWYTNLAGHLAKLLYGIPHVMTTHSLEPLRPWKAEQLGPGGYALSSFCERTAVESADAVVAVSGEMRRDVLAAYPAVDPDRVVVIHNGIDPDEYRPDPAAD